MTTAHSFWTVEPGRAELRAEQVPAPGSTDVEVQTLYSGISRGTETLVFRGRVPESLWDSMRAPFQVGDFPGPVKYGYANVGRVVGGDTARIGQTVFCLYPHQSRYIVPSTAALTVPADVPPARAVLGANMETALNAFWDACPLPGDKVTVVGAGALGCLLASLLTRSLALDVELVDVEPSRRTLAEALGARFALPGQCRTDRDLVFHTSATAAGMATCLGVCRHEARIVELSWYGAGTVPVELGGAFHSKRLRLQSSQVGSVSRNKPGWTHSERLALALSLLADPVLDGLLATPVPFSHLPEVFSQLDAANPDASAPPCLYVDYQTPLP